MVYLHDCGTPWLGLLGPDPGWYSVNKTKVSHRLNRAHNQKGIEL